ncbi:hypothetical protein C5167_009538 [Papaver somniferum]|uniref:Uncharacterized protein n=1 Tax=Papaver somniferum TaxID=3469 RepID=A0A4Y7K0M3_PAPSO|nr:uncharacterized protein LOC113285801 [Papaver somniferum]RZC65860.1 hypothetical protein C5167_009538 [Papaver somniferum]
MGSMKPSNRYPVTTDSRTSASSQVSDPSSSSDRFKNPNNNKSFLKHFSGKSSTRKSPDLISPTSNFSSKALVKPKVNDLAGYTNKVKPQDQNLSSLVKKFMDKRSSKLNSQQKTAALVIPADVIAEDLKKTAAAKGSKFSTFQRKLFQKGSSGGPEKKALTEVKTNTRTLAMVLRSERELLNQSKEFEGVITELKLIIEGKNREVEKLKDLCLNQREEIKALKTAILFPDVMNSQLQDILDKQGSELKQAKQVIPTLQRQVTSLTGQLQSLADGLAEVKADKYSIRGCYEGNLSSPRTPAFDLDATNSLEYSSEDGESPGSPDDMLHKDFNPCSDDMLLKDLNPCLTPYFAKSKEFDEMMAYDSPNEEGLFGSDTKMSKESDFDSQDGIFSKSSDHWGRPSLGATYARATRRSEENKCTYGRPLHHKLF